MLAAYLFGSRAKGIVTSESDHDFAAFVGEQAIQLNLKSIMLDLAGEVPWTRRARELLPKLLEAVKSALTDVEVYIFGCAIAGRLTADSDIDVLVVTDRAELRCKLAAEIEERLGEPLILENALTARDKLDRCKRHARELTLAGQLIQSAAR